MNIIDVGYRSTHYYLLADTRPRLLVDAGWPGSLGQMRHECERKGIRLGDIPYQLATHFHMDHAGLAQELKQIGARLIVLDTQLGGIPLLTTQVKPADHFTPISLEGNIVLKEEESREFLASIGVAGEIIGTPGHSDDSVTLILDEGIAFTGDLAPIRAVAHDPADLAWQSWQKIRSKGAGLIYPAHGPAWRLE